MLLDSKCGSVAATIPPSVEYTCVTRTLPANAAAGTTFGVVGARAPKLTMLAKSCRHSFRHRQEPTPAVRRAYQLPAPIRMANADPPSFTVDVAPRRSRQRTTPSPRSWAMTFRPRSGDRAAAIWHEVMERGIRPFNRT